MQDRSYSNKAWAKLAGLAPREIGRCERALGEALEWRLWVGKGLPTSPPTASQRAVARCKSEVVIRSPTCAWPTPTVPAALFTSHVAAVRAPARGRSNLRRAATMPDLEPGGCGLHGSAFFPADTASHMAMDCTFEGTLVAEPDMDEFDAAGQVPAVAAWSAPSIQASLNAGNFASPTASTPGLVYSPMSTSSTALSDDGDRMASFGFQPAHTSVGQPEVDMLTGKPSTYVAAFDRSPYTFGDLTHYAGSTPAYVPFVANMANRLAPPSDAVFNPVILERTVTHPHAGLHGSGSFGGVAPHAYDNSVNWSMSCAR